MSICGVIIGLVNGFFGGGGGMVAVPLLIYALKMPVKTAHATTIAVILPVSVISFAIYLFNNSFSVDITLYAMSGVILGGIAGAFLLSKLKNNIIKFIFLLLLIGAGVKMLI